MNIKFKAAMYVRISHDSKESDSIENQQRLILDYIKNQDDIEVMEIFSDRGYSGTTFERPEFNRMIEYVHNGKINCIIVKDLSRFGRNYIFAGRYIEEILPAYNVRFISISENYDSLNAESSQLLYIALMNMSHDYYARNISKSTKDSLNVLKNNGLYAVGGLVTYGYIRDKTDKYNLIIDLQAAKIIQNIFKARLDGNSFYKIANILNEKNILPPKEYKENQMKMISSLERKTFWRSTTVQYILGNKIYIGTIEMKKSTSLFRTKKLIKIPSKEWISVEGHHEPIIQKEVFYQVNKETFTTINVKQKVCIAGIIYCSMCKKNLTRDFKKKYKKGYYRHKEKENIICSEISIQETRLEQSLFAFITILLNMEILPDLQFLNQLDSKDTNVREKLFSFLKLYFISKIFIYKNNRIEICFKCSNFLE